MMQEKQLPSFAFNLTWREDKSETFKNTKIGRRKKKKNIYDIEFRCNKLCPAL